MYRKPLERAKTLILAILIVTSIVQVGILWDQQTHGLPFTFITGLFESPAKAEDADSNAREYFAPYRMIVSKGGEVQWIIDAADEKFKTLWWEATWYLGMILSSNQIIIDKTTIPYNEETWSSYAVQKAFIFEFKTSLPREIVAYFLGMTNSPAEGPSSVWKMAILPDENVNTPQNTVYILDGIENKIYKYTITVTSKSVFESIITDLSEDTAIRSYSVVKSMYPKSEERPYPIRPDLLIYSVIQNETFENIYCKEPKGLEQKEPDTDVIARSILGNEKEDRYQISLDANNVVSLMNLDNIYNIYPDGLVKYKNTLPVTESEKGSITDAFGKAIEYIAATKPWVTGVTGFYLSEAKEKDKYSYEFTFDYWVDNVPVVFNYQSIVQQKPLKNAINITANSKRVLESVWIVKNFEKKESYTYQVSFPDVMNQLFGDYPINNQEFSIKDLQVSYPIENNPAGMIQPVWLITTMEGTAYPIHLPAEDEKDK